MKSFKTMKDRSTNNTSHISYIITYRQANADRYRHLMTILDWLNNSRIPDFEVVIAEQRRRIKARDR